MPDRQGALHPPLPARLPTLAVALSPVVSGTPTSLFTKHDWSWFPLSNPGIISIPAGFLFGVIGTLTSRDPEAERRYDAMEVRALTGAGAEPAGTH